MSIQDSRFAPSSNTARSSSGSGVVALVLGAAGLASVCAAWFTALVRGSGEPSVSPIALFAIGALLGLAALVTGLIARRSTTGRVGLGLGIVALLGVSGVLLFVARARPIESPQPSAVVAPAAH